MIPIELKKDKDGLLYYSEDDILRRTPLMIDKRDNLDNRYYQHSFYSIPSTDEYIIKYCITCYTRKEIRKIKYMLDFLIKNQNNIPSVDFPIGYFVQRKKLAGLIIKYYKNGISCDNIFNLCDIENIGKYYYHDEDSIHNLFNLYNELLEIIWQMFENNVYYTDINPGNVIIDNNKIKMIDFDYRYVLFDKKDESLKIVLSGYYYFLKNTLTKLNLYNNQNIVYDNFEKTKKYLKTLENQIRKR